MKTQAHEIIVTFPDVGFGHLSPRIIISMRPDVLESWMVSVIFRASLASSFTLYSSNLFIFALTIFNNGKKNSGD